MFFRLLIILIIPFFSLQVNAKPPQLTPKDTKTKINEILKAHVSHQALSEELVKRAVLNYIDELDPLKTYFIESDINPWLDPSHELLKETLEGFHQERFTTFEDIHEKMILAIQRRNSLEDKMKNAPLATNVQPSEFKELKWVKTKEELSDRLCRIKSLQLQAGDKIDSATKEQFFQLITKRRLNRENELIGNNANERKRIVLSHVLKSTSSALDSQTLYFTPSEASQFMIQVQQKLFGIGAQLRDDLSGFTVMRIVEGSPAAHGNKLKVGDRVIAVNQEPVVGMDIVEAVELIRGPQGSVVVLTVLREKNNDNKEDEKLDIEIIRGEIVLKETRLETSFEPFGDGVIGILHLFSFYQDNNFSSTSDLAEAIEKLKSEYNLKGIVLDLRNNSGGLLPQAVSVAGLFISKGIVVSVKDNSGHIQHLRNFDTKKMWDGPLVILTNRASASAAEIVAQTLQEYGRALVIGDPETFGKGTFQTFTLESANFGKVNPKGEYKVTRGRYYTVSGRSPQLVGVKADIVVPGIYSEMEVGEKYSKFPVETDQISANFEDDFSDIPALHRSHVKRLYQGDAQVILTTYEPYLAKLQKNSELRIAQNKNYQNFIKEIAKKDDFAEAFEFFGQNDLQRDETLNIMKDLIHFMESKPDAKAA